MTKAETSKLQSTIKQGYAEGAGTFRLGCVICRSSLDTRRGFLRGRLHTADPHVFSPRSSR